MSDINTDITIAVPDDLALVHIAARDGASDEIDAKAKSTFGVGLPLAARAVEHDGRTIVWAGPQQWLVVQKQVADLDLLSNIKQAFGNLVSAVDNGDSRFAVVVAGASAQNALSKVIPVDFHDRAFPPGSVAITQCFHLGVTLWRAASGESFTLLGARTYADDFLRHLKHALGASATGA